MGLHKEMNAFLRKYAPSAFTSQNAEVYRNQAIAIDASAYLYQYANGVLKSMTDRLTHSEASIDREEMFRRMIYSVLNFSLSLMEQQIVPIWIKEGVTPIEKSQTLAKRFSVKAKAQLAKENIQAVMLETDPFELTSKDWQQVQTLTVQHTHLNHSERERLFDILSLFGFAVISAPGEAEAYGASLTIGGYAAALLSRDTDAYALGTTQIISKSKIRSKDLVFDAVNIHEIYRCLQCTPEFFRDFAIAGGTDFFPKLTGIGLENTWCLLCKESLENCGPRYGLNLASIKRARELMSPPAIEHRREQLNYNYAQLDNILKDPRVEEYSLEGYYNRAAALTRFKLQGQIVYARLKRA